MAYGETDRCTGGTASADTFLQAGYEAAKAFDDNADSWWVSAFAACPHWHKYDFGAGVSWRIGKITLQANFSGKGTNSFTVYGSNNDSDWTELYSDNMVDDTSVQTFTWSQATAYRYIKIISNSSYYVDGRIYEAETEMFEDLTPREGGAFLLNMI
jgi:hypothetical protein